MFEELSMPLPDKNRYLERIGAQGLVTPDKKTLDKLIHAHQITVPFENLDICEAGLDISLETAALYEKIVERQRGGYCFELNSLFMSLLESMGYDCYPVAVRIIWYHDGYMPVTHRANIVRLGGKRFFCDVGFGGPQPRTAIDLDETEPQQSGTDLFIFDKADDGDAMLSRLTGNGREKILKFSERACQNVDFLAPNEYQSKSPNSAFRRMRMLNLATECGSVSLNGNVLRIRNNRQVVEKTLNTEEELVRAIKDYFGITVNFSLKI